MREIAQQAQFSLTERLSEDEPFIALVYAGLDGAGSNLSQFDAYDEPLQTRGSVSHLTDTDLDGVIVMDQTLMDDLGGSQSSFFSECDSLEDQVPPRPHTKPSQPYQPPQIMGTHDGWYRGEDCFDPGEVAPMASPQQLPSLDGGLDWGGEGALPPLHKTALCIWGGIFRGQHSTPAPPRAVMENGQVWPREPDKTVVAWPPITSKWRRSGGRRYGKASTSLPFTNHPSSSFLPKGLGLV